MLDAATGIAYSVRIQMNIVHCANCSLPFGIPTDMETRRRADGEKFYCPLGHVNLYKASLPEVQKKLDEANRLLKVEQEARRVDQARLDKANKAFDAEAAAHFKTKEALKLAEARAVTAVVQAAVAAVQKDAAAAPDGLDDFEHEVEEQARKKLLDELVKAIRTTLPVGSPPRTAFLAKVVNRDEVDVLRDLEALAAQGRVIARTVGNEVVWSLSEDEIGLVRTRVMKVLREAGKPMRYDEIAVLANAGRGTVTTYLSVACRKGEVTRTAPGTYALA